MDSPLVRRLLAGALAIVALLALLLLLWPEERVAKRPSPPVPAAEPAEVVEAAPAAEVGRAQLVRGVPIEDLPDPTEKCVMLVEWNNRNVPPWVMEKNMDAQAMKFDDRDMACMAAGGLPDQILDRAEQNRLRPQPAPR